MDREHTLHQDTWLVDINNYRELGECVATFNHRIGNDSFIGTAEMTVEDGIRKVEITLICDENERYRCELCQRIPHSPSLNEPGICTFCGIKVCGNCKRNHDKGHWRPQRTIGGDLICTEKTPCGKDQCPTCGGAPF